MEACRRKGGSGAILPQRGFRPPTEFPKAISTGVGAPAVDRRWEA